MNAYKQERYFVIVGLLLLGIGIIQLIALLVDPSHTTNNEKYAEMFPSFLISGIPGILSIIYSRRFLRSLRYLNGHFPEKFKRKMPALYDWELLLLEQETYNNYNKIKERLIVFDELSRRQLIDDDQHKDKSIKIQFQQSRGLTQLNRVDGICITKNIIWVSWFEIIRSDYVIMTNSVKSYISHDKGEITQVTLIRNSTNQRIRIRLHISQFESFANAMNSVNIGQEH